MYPGSKSFDQAAHEARIAIHLVNRRLEIEKLLVMVTVPYTSGNVGQRRLLETRRK